MLGLVSPGTRNAMIGELFKGDLRKQLSFQTILVQNSNRARYLIGTVFDSLLEHTLFLWQESQAMKHLDHHDKMPTGLEHLWVLGIAQFPEMFYL